MNNLCETRKQKGLTQRELSQRTGIRPCYLSEIERGVNKANKTTREKIESVIGKIDWIEVEGVKLESPSFFKAERLLKKLIVLTLAMEVSQRNEFHKLINKYFKTK